MAICQYTLDEQVQLSDHCSKYGFVHIKLDNDGMGAIKSFKLPEGDGEAINWTQGWPYAYVLQHYWKTS